MSKDATPSHSGKTLAGLVILAIGVTLLLRQFDFFSFPSWIFSWPMLLILIGLYTGAKSNYRNVGWIIPVLIGFVFLVGKAFPGLLSLNQYLWPTLLILFGAYLLFKKRHHAPEHRDAYTQPGEYPQQADYYQPGEYPYQGEFAQPEQYAYAPPPPPRAPGSEFIEATAVLGGIKKNIFSKNVTGGEITSFLGGVELNLTQADIQGQVVLEVTQVMGGTKLIVPSHWDVVSDMVAVLGGLEDKRMINVSHIDKDKRLIIKGTSVMGGVQITSYA